MKPHAEIPQHKRESEIDKIPERSHMGITLPRPGTDMGKNNWTKGRYYFDALRSDTPIRIRVVVAFNHDHWKFVDHVIRRGAARSDVPRFPFALLISRWEIPNSAGSDFLASATRDQRREAARAFLQKKSENASTTPYYRKRARDWLDEEKLGVGFPEQSLIDHDPDEAKPAWKHLCELIALHRAWRGYHGYFIFEDPTREVTLGFAAPHPLSGNPAEIENYLIRLFFLPSLALHMRASRGGARDLVDFSEISPTILY